MNYPESIAAQVGTPQGLDNYWLPFTPNRYFREHPKLIAGAFVVECIFAWPGIGHALVHAVFWRDVPMIQGCTLLLAWLFVLLNTLTDLLCLAIDPRGPAEP